MKMNFDALTRKSIENLGKLIVRLMPKKSLANEVNSAKYMLPGDEYFDFSSGDFFTNLGGGFNTYYIARYV